MFRQSASKTGSQTDRQTDDTDTLPTNITIELPMRSLQLSRYRNQFDKCAMKSQAITECSALETGQTQDIISGWWETHTKFNVHV